MVVDECHGIFGHPADEPWRLPFLILQPPILTVPACFLQDSLGRKVKSCGSLVSGVDPIDEQLSMMILVLLQPIVIIGHVTPELANSPGRPTFLTILADIL